MGRNLSTKIVYGYDIGSANGDDGWKFEEFNRSTYEMEWPDWVEREVGDEDDPDDFISQAKDRLLTQITGFQTLGYDEIWPDSYYKQKNDAQKRLGIEFEIYGVGDYTEWVMGFEMARDSDSISVLDQELIASLLNPLNLADMDYRLREAIRVLQLKPKGQPAPRLFLLASYF